MTNRTVTRSLLAAAAAGVLALSACSSDNSTKPAETTAAETSAAETSAAPSAEETESSEPTTDSETGAAGGAGVEGTFNDADVQVDDEKGAGTPQAVAKEFMTGFIDKNPKAVCAVISPNEEKALEAEGGCEVSLTKVLDRQNIPAGATLEGSTYTVKAKDDTTTVVEIRRPGKTEPFTLHTEQVDGRWYAKR